MLLKSDYRKYLDGVYWNDIDNNTKDCYMNGDQLNKWIIQNKGGYIDSIEGTLIDNYVVSCKNGTAFVLEEYMNEGASVYHVYYCKRNVGECFNKLWEHWDNMAEEREGMENALYNISC